MNNNTIKHIKKLPKELISIIFSYTYQPQPILIRNDIISYYETNIIIRDIFRDRFLFHTDIYDDIKSLLFNIINFITSVENNTFVDYGYKKKLSHLSNNYYKLRKLQDICNFRINVFWGLFTPDIRNRFIEICLTK